MAIENPHESVASDPVLTEAEWSGLARLGQLVHLLDKSWTETGLGETLTGEIAEGLRAVPADTWPALLEATRVLRDLHQNGVLGQLADVLGFMTRTPEIWQEVLPQLARKLAEAADTVDWAGAGRLAQEASHSEALVALFALLRYLTKEAPPEFLADMTTLGHEVMAGWNQPGLRQAGPSLITLLVTLHETGVLAQLTDLLHYYQSFQSVLNVDRLMTDVLQYLATSTLMDDFKRIRPEGLMRLLAEVSQPDTTRTLVSVVQLLRFMSQGDIFNEFMSQLISISSTVFDKEFLNTLPDLLDTAVLLRQSGLLNALQKVVEAYPNLAQMPWNQYIMLGAEQLGRLNIGETLGKVRRALEETQEKAPRLGGMGGLMRIMRDPATQRVMQFGIALLSQFIPA